MENENVPQEKTANNAGEGTVSAAVETQTQETNKAVTADSAPASNASSSVDTSSQTPVQGSEPEKKPEGAGGETPSVEHKEDKDPGKNLVEDLKKTRKRAQTAEQENAYLRGQLAEREKGKQTTATTTQSTEDADKPPDINDYPDLDTFSNAQIEYQVRKQVNAEVARRKKVEEEEKEKAHLSEIDRNFKIRVNKAIERYPDYSDVLQSAQVELDPSVLNAIKESELGPDIAYYLAKNVEDMDKISQMKPLAAVREIGKLEAKLSAPPQTQTKQVTQAPEPIKPTGGQASVAKKDLGNMPIDEYMKQRNSETFVRVGNRMQPRR